ncbi:outer membrane protein assembly factor [Bacteroidia bacterium]|nr:outer membrane protein assembly factor [Bacteroidia bacterium]
MYKKISFFIISLFLCGTIFSQEQNIDTISAIDTTEIGEVPNISYTEQPKEYEIAGITTTGATNYEDFILIGFSGLSVGQKINVPGDAITNAIKKFWKQGFFSDVNITATKVVGDKIWLNIALEQRPRISKINFSGMKKSEREDISAKIGISNGSQLTPNLINRTKEIIKKFYEDKGYLNAEVTLTQRDDPDTKGSVIVDISVDKKKKVKVSEFFVDGNKALSDRKVDWVMKKTNRKRRIMNIFKSKKYIKENFDEDKKTLIDKYNELGYRDAVLVKDSVYRINDKSVAVYLDINEGKKYYFRNISWIGNTLYPTALLQQTLRIKKGDVYNTKKLNDRVNTDEDAVGNIYMDNGYLFSHIDPVEVNIIGDSIDVEMHIFEGPQATINNIIISGNTRVYENVVRRELRIKPGQLFSKTDLQRTLREIAQMGHFDPEKLNPDIQPNMENGTVDIGIALEPKGSDQVELSAGWGSTGIIFSGTLKFTNFSMQNIFKPETYRIVPQGDGQTFAIRAQTNGSYYYSGGVSFMEPWLGGKRPTSLTVSANYSKQTGMSSRYYDNYYQNYYYQQLYGDNYYTSDMFDDDKYLKIISLSAGIGTRLTFPDDYFTLYGELAFLQYRLRQWGGYFPISDGTANNLSLNLTLSRNSIDNPYYTTSGSQFSLSAQVTPPYSLFDGKDYSDPELPASDRYNWIEYHKWKFKAKTFTPLTRNEKLVFMARAEFGYLGYFNKNKKSPFETFYMGGDGMSSSSYLTETVGLRGYESGALSVSNNNGTLFTAYDNLYAKLGFELRYPIMTGQTTIYALTFMDAGNAWVNGKDFNPFELKRSAGVGLRIFLPMIGLMGVDWGYGFDKVWTNDGYKVSGSQFNFVLGQEF